MKVVYKKSVMNLIMDKIAEAKELGKEIDYVELDKDESKRLMKELKSAILPDPLFGNLIKVGDCVVKLAF